MTGRRARASCNNRSNVATRLDFSSGGQVSFSCNASSSRSSSGLIEDGVQDFFTLLGFELSVPERATISDVLKRRRNEIRNGLVRKPGGLHRLLEERACPFQLVQQPGVFCQSIRRKFVGEVAIFQCNGASAHIIPVFHVHFEIASQALSLSAGRVHLFRKRSCQRTCSHCKQYHSQVAGWQDLRFLNPKTLRYPNRSSNFP